jgi:alcohol dehydrogenase (NADP+)
VRIEILHCGVCHSDLHQVRDEWGRGHFPMVPGHEIVGRVSAVGSAVKKFKEGDLVGVGCMVDSCRTCASCAEGLEQYCESGFTGTYNAFERDGVTPTYGGYSDSVVVDQAFVLRIPKGLDPAGAAPLLCAGITTWSPLRHWQVRAGQKVGIVGLGGLGHMGLKFAHAFGARTVLFTTSPGKSEDARRLGADEVVISKNRDELRKHLNSFDFILDTVSAPHDLNQFLVLLKRQGTMTLVGLPDKDPVLKGGALIFRRRSLSGSIIGGIAETQEMLDFCGEHGIVSDIEAIRMEQINEAYERMLRSDVKYRFVIDLASLKA